MIEFKNVTKTFKNGYTANKNISFTVEKGDVIGLVGPNGSGKTTLIRQLFHLLETTEGEITVDGKTKYMDLISYVPQFAAIYPALTVAESIDVTLRYQGYEKAFRKKKVEEVLSILDMQDIRNVYTYMLSGGQKKLLGFACGIASDKPYLILDEVTSMVDIVTKEKIWNVITQLKKEKGIILASHDMAEVKQHCNEIVVLKNGNMIFKGKSEEIKIDFCKCSIMSEDNAKMISLIEERECKFEMKEEVVSIITDTLDEMLKLIYDINMVTKITKFECEHPAFYEGVMKIVKEN